jgi:ribosomal-protein-alanine N-acetyltransferase
MERNSQQIEWFYEIPKVETEHYYLRGMRKEDAPKMFVFMSDLETIKFITPHPVQTMDAMIVTIKNSLENFKLKKEIPWVVMNKQDGDLIGMFRFHKLHLWHRKTEMGVVIRKDYQNKGVMSEVLEKVYLLDSKL